ncbi:MULTISPECIES: flagellar protein FlaG [Pseudoalteromonas]|uniref:Flagellin n=2 Tax=Pseudoalteromonas fuliginea TaxID=1872678 RepID=A0ABD3Y552_9GAMM|nr:MULTISPECIES: flagellar protein FlaG [Pseudoalteromonas]ALQ09809.1 flagellin [Pseudoalteromonas sp. Bsw20308]ATG76840.1 flagellin [Pseudoalteromonas sp. 1_2015MBL_MicDiv]KDC49267.1 flagellin [Pseudoalteromonas fuliginea]KDC53856.1 flagellin [Pseudoalteromonas sp. S3431]KJZ28919.1 flagellin [Pseudoalteromonas fuliginea]
MNTITSSSETMLPVSTTASDVKQAGNTASNLTERAIDDVKQVDTQTQQQLQQKMYEKEAEDKQQPLEREQLEEMAQQLQDFMGEMNRSLQFKVDEDSGRDVIKVLDKNSGEVIKQYPSEEVLSLVSKLSESAGILIDQTV